MAATAVADAQPAVVDGIAAIVNSDVITYSAGPRADRAARESCSARNTPARNWTKQIKAAARSGAEGFDRSPVDRPGVQERKIPIARLFVEQRVNEIIQENFGGDRNTFIKTLQAQNYSLERIQEDGVRENHRRGDAQQKRQAATRSLRRRRSRNITGSIARNSPARKQIQTAHDHDPEQASDGKPHRRKRWPKRF